MAQSFETIIYTPTVTAAVADSEVSIIINF